MTYFDQNTLDKLYQLYIKERIGFNDICQKCKLNEKLVNGPMPIFHVGKNYMNCENRLVFIGTVAYGWNDILKDPSTTWHRIFNQDNYAIKKTQQSIEERIRELYFQEMVAPKFISYIEAACTEIFGSIENGFSNIAITHFVHCHSGLLRDSLPQSVRSSCADFKEAGFIHKELQILNPTHIIVLTKNYNYTRFAVGFDTRTAYLEVPSPDSIESNMEDFVCMVKGFCNSI